MSEESEEIVEERIYMIPLAQAWIAPVKKRAPRAMRIIKSFLERHMKLELIVISPEVSEEIWKRGIEKPPRRIRVRVTRDGEDVVRVYLVSGE